jgi:hypothetical protein
VSWIRRPEAYGVTFEQVAGDELLTLEAEHFGLDGQPPVAAPGNWSKPYGEE